ncbi:hypothetical protein VPH35_097295 [Triticum aestivum]
MAGDGELLPRIAVVGAGIFARTQYIPRLREISHLVVLKAIWSRTQESAEAAAELARDFAPGIECKWGDAGLEEIMGDPSILGVAVVLAGQVQVELSLKMLKAGKHVIQEVATVSSISRHVDTDLPPPDNICSLFQLENGCAGVLVFAVKSRSPKILWRVDGTKGTVQIERGVDGGKHGYQVLFSNESGECQKTFYPFCGVHEELKAFVHDMVQASKDGDHKAEPRSSYVEGARDVAVLEAMLESSAKQGAMVQVKKF